MARFPGKFPTLKHANKRTLIKYRRGQDEVEDCDPEIPSILSASGGKKTSESGLKSPEPWQERMDQLRQNVILFYRLLDTDVSEDDETERDGGKHRRRAKNFVGFSPEEIAERDDLYRDVRKDDEDDEPLDGPPTIGQLLESPAPSRQQLVLKPQPVAGLSGRKRPPPVTATINHRNGTSSPVPHQLTSSTVAQKRDNSSNNNNKLNNNSLKQNQRERRSQSTDRPADQVQIEDQLSGVGSIQSSGKSTPQQPITQKRPRGRPKKSDIAASDRSTPSSLSDPGLISSGDLGHNGSISTKDAGSASRKRPTKSETIYDFRDSETSPEIQPAIQPSSAKNQQQPSITSTGDKPARKMTQKRLNRSVAAGSPSHDPVTALTTPMGQKKITSFFQKTSSVTSGAESSMDSADDSADPIPVNHQEINLMASTEPLKSVKTVAERRSSNVDDTIEEVVNPTKSSKKRSKSTSSSTLSKPLNPVPEIESVGSVAKNQARKKGRMPANPKSKQKVPDHYSTSEHAAVDDADDDLTDVDENIENFTPDPQPTTISPPPPPEISSPAKKRSKKKTNRKPVREDLDGSDDDEPSAVLSNPTHIRKKKKFAASDSESDSDTPMCTAKSLRSKALLYADYMFKAALNRSDEEVGQGVTGVEEKDLRRKDRVIARIERLLQADWQERYTKFALSQQQQQAAQQITSSGQSADEGLSPRSDYGHSQQQQSRFGMNSTFGTVPALGDSITTPKLFGGKSPLGQSTSKFNFGFGMASESGTEGGGGMGNLFSSAGSGSSSLAAASSKNILRKARLTLNKRTLQKIREPKGFGPFGGSSPVSSNQQSSHHQIPATTIPSIAIIPQSPLVAFSAATATATSPLLIPVAQLHFPGQTPSGLMPFATTPTTTTPVTMTRPPEMPLSARVENSSNSHKMKKPRKKTDKSADKSHSTPANQNSLTMGDMNDSSSTTIVQPETTNGQGKPVGKKQTTITKVKTKAAKKLLLSSPHGTPLTNGKPHNSSSPAKEKSGRVLVVPEKPDKITEDPKEKISSGQPGWVTCNICGVTKYYSHVQRRYGQFSCEPCSKFFARFLRDPKQFYCETTGECPIAIELTVKNSTTPLRAASSRCKACWLKVCLQKFAMDDKIRETITERFAPKLRSAPDVSLITVDTSEPDPVTAPTKLKREPQRISQTLLMFAPGDEQHHDSSSMTNGGKSPKKAKKTPKKSLNVQTPNGKSTKSAKKKKQFTSDEHDEDSDDDDEYMRESHLTPSSRKLAHSPGDGVPRVKHVSRSHHSVKGLPRARVGPIESSVLSELPPELLPTPPTATFLQLPDQPLLPSGMIPLHQSSISPNNNSAISISPTPPTTTTTLQAVGLGSIQYYPVPMDSLIYAQPTPVSPQFTPTPNGLDGNEHPTGLGMSYNSLSSVERHSTEVPTGDLFKTKKRSYKKRSTNTSLPAGNGLDSNSDERLDALDRELEIDLNQQNDHQKLTGKRAGKMDKVNSSNFSSSVSVKNKSRRASGERRIGSKTADRTHLNKHSDRNSPLVGPTDQDHNNHDLLKVSATADWPVPFMH